MHKACEWKCCGLQAARGRGGDSCSPYSPSAASAGKLEKENRRTSTRRVVRQTEENSSKRRRRDAERVGRERCAATTGAARERRQETSPCPYLNKREKGGEQRGETEPQLDGPPQGRTEGHEGSRRGRRGRGERRGGESERERRDVWEQRTFPLHGVQMRIHLARRSRRTLSRRCNHSATLPTRTVRSRRGGFILLVRRVIERAEHRRGD